MKSLVCIAVIVMGFSGLVAEILLLRELLIVFAGNELSIGIILANWLILEAFGCFFPGRLAEKAKHQIETFTGISVLFSLSLVLAVYLTRGLKGFLGVSVGESIGLLPITYASFLILLPVSVFHGALFTFSCRLYAMFSAADASSVGRVYVYETIGTIIGGVVCTYLLVPHLNTFQAAFGVAVLNLGVGLALLVPRRNGGPMPRAALALTGMLSLVVVALLLGGYVDRLHWASVRAQWRNLRVVHYQNSQYGNICVVENQGQYVFFEDGIPDLITPVPDTISVEEFVHLPLLAHPQPAGVLIVSGGAGGVIHEVLKHGVVETIEYAELDPLLLSLVRKFHTPLTESELTAARVKVRHLDGRLLLKTTPNSYDLIFIGIGEPSNLQANRFFTQEFFALAKSRLNAGGILVLAAPGSLTLVNEDLRDLNSCIFHTLSSVFRHVRVLPGDGRNIFLASDAPAIATMERAQIIQRLHERGLIVGAMLPRHIENKLHPGWQDWFARFIAGGSREINRDFRPLGLFYSLSYWNTLFAPEFGRIFRQFERIRLEGIFLSFLLFLVLYFAFRWQKRSFPPGIPFAIFTTGFAGMIFDLVVIFAFQSVYGYVFSWIGLLVAAFMAGAAGGAALMTGVLGRSAEDRRRFIKVELGIVCLAVGLPFALLALHPLAGSRGDSPISGILFLVISFACGFAIGSQFPLANKLYLQNNPSLTGAAGSLYASDLLGGWLGGVVGAVVLLPVFGLVGTCMVVGLLKIVSLIVVASQTLSVFVRR